MAGENKLRRFLGLVTALASMCGACSGIERPSMSSVAGGRLAQAEERLRPIIKRNLTLVAYQRSMNFPFDFSNIASYWLGAKPIGDGICEVNLVEYYVSPSRNMMQEGPTFELAVEKMIESPLRVTDSNPRTVYAVLPQSRVGENASCNRTKDASRYIRARDANTIRRGVSLLGEIKRRQDASGDNLAVECRLPRGCGELIESLSPSSVSSMSVLTFSCQQRVDRLFSWPTPSFDEEPAAHCFEFELRTPQSEGTSFLTMLVDPIESPESPMKIRMFRYAPPPV